MDQWESCGDPPTEGSPGKGFAARSGGPGHADLTAEAVRTVPPRVRSGEDLAQVLDGHPRVERRRREAAVAEQLLDVADVGAAAEEVRRAGVAQRVR